MMTSVLRTHVEYSAWASRQLVEAAAGLSTGELTRDFETADRSVLGTLVHIYAADRVWLARLKRMPHGPYVSEADYQLSVLQTDWAALMDSWVEWVRGISEEEAMEPVSYHDMRGVAWTQPLWQLVLHVVNHGTHHRGQVAGFLRSLGHTPPKLDLVFYYREFPATERSQSQR